MNRQLKCNFLILIIAILLLGIGLEAFQTGSSFLCTYSSSDSTEKDILQLSDTHTLFSKNLFLLEGIRHSYRATCIRQGTQRSYFRNNRISFSIIAHLTILPLLFVCAGITSFNVTFKEALYFMVIIGYIHLSDGKKPRYSYS